MANKRNIRRAAEYTDRQLLRRQVKHVKMIEKSIQRLQNSIINQANRLVTNSSGNIEGLAVNLKQAQSIHKKIEALFGTEFNNSTRLIINDFKVLSDVIERSFGYLDESIKFTSIDMKTMDILRDGYYQEYLAIGNTQKNKIIQSIYDQVIGGGEFSTLVSTIEQALMGSNVSGIPGRSLVQYSRLYARDMIMNFHNEVNIEKAKEAGLNHFLYIGDIIATTRDFCRKRVGKYYTKGQINSWKYKWAGKSGPAMTHRGGYNCRHHWQPIRPEWMDGKKKLNVADWNLEHRENG